MSDSARILDRASSMGFMFTVQRRLARFRTAMTMGMFALIVLTLVYLSIISLMFRNQVGDQTAGGVELVLT